MAKVSDFIHNIFTQAGIEATDEQLAAVVKATATLDIPDEHISKFHEGFFSLDAAKGKLKPVIISEFADGIVRNMSDMAKKAGFTDDEISALVKNNGKDAKAFASILLEEVNKKAEATHKKGGSAAADEYKRQLEELQNKLENDKLEAIKPFQTQLEALKTRQYEAWERAEFAGLPLNKSIPDIARIPAVKGAIGAELQALGGQLIYDFETGLPKLVKSDDNTVPLFHENKPLEWKTFLGLTVQKHKLLDENPGGGDNNPAPHTIVIPQNGNDGKKSTLKVADDVYNDVSKIFTATQ